MAFRFFALVAALACVSSVAAFPKAAHYARPAPACGAALPAIPTEVVTSVIPGPVSIGPDAAGVVAHASAPYEINYFGKPWIVKHQKSAALNVFTQTPVVVDEYAAPAFSEGPGPQTVVVEEVYGAPTQIAGAPAYAAPAYAPSYAASYAAPAYAHGAYAAPAYAAPAYGCH